MKGDFSRVTFDAAKHFSRVLNQQGRVTLDADFNEQAEILVHVMRTMARDLFGPHGGPTDSNGGGFRLKLQKSGTDGWQIEISAGHYYVDGILCECDGCTYTTQPDYGSMGTGFLEGDASLLEWLRKPAKDQPYWIYLDVWERHVTWIEDDSIREVALGAGAADTCTRSKVVWQVKALPWDEDEWGSTLACEAPVDVLPGTSTARMAAQLVQGSQIPDPCIIAPDAKYRGAENQLYRVEIHDGGVAGDATFKWSRDNGSIATRWLGTEGNDLIVANTRGFAEGGWIELSDDGLDLSAKPGVLLKTTKIQGDRVSVDATTASGSMAWTAQRSNPKVRRWDQSDNDSPGLKNGAISIVESADPEHPTWIDLEDGIQVWFEDGGDYRSGDYWLIPARVATGSIDWKPDASGGLLKPPLGVEHHYAPLGIINWAAPGEIQDSIQYCRVCTDRRVVACAPATTHTSPSRPTGSGPTPARSKRPRKNGPA